MEYTHRKVPGLPLEQTRPFVDPLPTISAVDPIAFSIGSFAIHWYGVFVAAGFLAGLWTAGRRGLRDRLSPQKISDLGPWIIVGGLIGARLLYVLSYWKEDFAGQSWVNIFQCISNIPRYISLKKKFLITHKDGRSAL